MKRGVPPTERKARTGELTPPGMVCWARSKSCWLRDMATWGPKDLENAFKLARSCAKWRAKRRKYAAFARYLHANVREHGEIGTILAVAAGAGGPDSVPSA